MDRGNGFPDKAPERREPRESRNPDVRGEGPEAPLPPLPPLPEPPQEDALVRFLRKVPMYAFIAFLGVVAADYLFPGVKVAVQNGGPGTMRNVTVSVRMETKPLEPIPEGQEGNARFRLWGDAHVLISYTDEDGKSRQLDAGEHRFSSMSGTIPVRVRKGKLQ